jgi:2-polyprenyl-3-methyl-5-hydroxy-6-metoxy-1,4-benzoquinol methylase
MRIATRADNPFERLAMAAGQVPTPLFDTYVAFFTARAVMAGASLGIFAALAERPDNAAALASRLELDPPGVDVLVTALHALGYLEAADGGRYAVTSATRKWLLDEDTSVAAFATVFDYDMWDHIGRMEEGIRSGQPIGLHERPADDPYWERYMRGLFEVSRLASDIAARLIGARNPRSALDLAGGHGEYSMALCRRHEGLTATIVDLEGATRIGRRIVEEQGMADRVTYRIGDLFETDLGTGHDIAMANSITHHFDEERNVAMLRRAREALRPGGTMAVLDLERAEPGKRGTQIGTLTGLLFYVTSHARTYSGRELEGFLEAAGFERVRSRRHTRLPGTVLVLGRAPSSSD